VPKAQATPGPSRAQVVDALRRAFLDGHELRDEDERKVGEIVPLLGEIDRAARGRRREPFHVVDACAGKSALGVLAAALVLRHAREGQWQITAIEHEPRRRALALSAAEILEVKDHVRFVTGDVGDAALWPVEPDLVVALHACGSATDDVIDRSVAADAKRVLLLPCCYAGAATRHDGRAATSVPAQPVADAWAARVPLPRHGLVGRRFSQALIDAERTLRLEAAGFETEVLELFSPSVSPYNFLWRARRVKEPVRMADARAKLDALRRS
jgi:hypothetical protein